MTARAMFYPESKKFTDREERAFARIDLAFAVTEDLLVAMEDQDISKAELAKLLGKSKSFVSQILSGDRNMTLGTLSDIAYVLKLKPKFKLRTEEEHRLEEEGVMAFNELPKDLSKLFSEPQEERPVVRLKAPVHPIRSTTVINAPADFAWKWLEEPKRAVGC